MVTRETRDFVKAALAIQKADPAFQSMAAAKQQAVQLLGVLAPSDADFKIALAELPARRGRGRRPSVELTKRDAVAAVAVYFESVGAGAEQAIVEAKRWLNIPLSRRVAKEAVVKYKASTSPDQFKLQAKYVYQAVRQGTTQELPAKIDRVRKKRQKPNLI